MWNHLQAHGLHLGSLSEVQVERQQQRHFTADMHGASLRLDSGTNCSKQCAICTWCPVARAWRGRRRGLPPAPAGERLRSMQGLVDMSGECWNQTCIAIQLPVAAAAKPDASQPKPCSLHMDGTRYNFKSGWRTRGQVRRKMPAPADLICMRHQWR